MSITFSRVRGDNYPIEVTIKIDDVLVPLDGSVLTFSFKASDGSGATESISGVIDPDNIGKVLFTPTVAQMSISGQYKFDVQRENGGVFATHLTGTMLLTDDVSL